jgi:aspartyl protease family protein
MKNTDSNNNIGQGMIYLAWMLFLGLLTYGFNNYLEKQHNPNQTFDTRIENNTVEVRLRQNRYGHYVVNGQINHQPVTFLLDTGATVISIPETIASQLRLKKAHPVHSRTANGIIKVFTTRLDSVSVGAIELNNIRATINPHMQGKEILLGMSFLKHLEMMQKGQELTLRY